MWLTLAPPPACRLPAKIPSSVTQPARRRCHRQHPMSTQTTAEPISRRCSETPGAQSHAGPRLTPKGGNPRGTVRGLLQGGFATSRQVLCWAHAAALTTRSAVSPPLSLPEGLSAPVPQPPPVAAQLSSFFEPASCPSSLEQPPRAVDLGALLSGSMLASVPLEILSLAAPGSPPGLQWESPPGPSQTHDAQHSEYARQAQRNSLWPE
mmetsp:Transcript_34133/g.79793  ORF Transcript_34133/g.79793 Transcript_34133/m.79793 type:complete len:208 (-) Transcript_34133:1234-1857(-)